MPSGELTALMRQSEDSAARRGHNLGPWQDLGSSGRIGGESCRAACLTCGAEVTATTKPMPNAVDIAGPAVALNCPAELTPAGMEGADHA